MIEPVAASQAPGPIGYLDDFSIRQCLTVSAVGIREMDQAPLQIISAGGISCQCSRPLTEKVVALANGHCRYRTDGLRRGFTSNNFFFGTMSVNGKLWQILQQIERTRRVIYRTIWPNRAGSNHKMSCAAFEVDLHIAVFDRGRRRITTSEVIVHAPAGPDLKLCERKKLTNKRNRVFIVCIAIYDNESV